MKKPGILLSVIALTITIIFVEPARNYLNRLFFENKDKMEEENPVIVPAAKKLKPEIKNKNFELQDEIMNYRLKSKDKTRQIQIALKSAGFYKGEIDGRNGSETKKAIKMFQRSKGLQDDGIVGPMTWKKLNKYLTD